MIIISLASYSARPYVIVSGEDRYNSAESSNNFQIDKNVADAKRAGDKSTILLTNHHTMAAGGDGDEDEIKGDASGITVPLSKSLGEL